MIIDASQYAGIASEMAQTNSFLQVKEFQNDYLDKPPLLFWVSSFFIKTLGISNFSYKIGSFLFLLFSLYAIYRFTLLYYSAQIAKNAALILATSQAYFLMTNDVRTDAMLTSCVITAVWLLSAFFENKKWLYLIFGSTFIALGMMAKGPIALIAILLPLGINLLYQGNWKMVFNWKWIIVLFTIAFLLLPMSYGLYTQFDLHPEKIIGGKSGQSGLYFYYWLQSFGRITGENVWNNGLPWHFFLGSSLWDYFPWILPLYFAIFTLLKKVFLSKTKLPEITSLAGFTIVFAMLSLSKYKLPHYIFVTFPFASIMAANYFENTSLNSLKKWKTVYFILGIIILLIFIAYPVFFFKEFSIWILICGGLQLAILWFYKKFKDQYVSHIIASVIILNVFLSFVFYPKLLTYQADSVAAKWAVNNINKEPVYLFGAQSHSFNFYSKNPFNKVLQTQNLDKLATPCWLYCDSAQLTIVQEKNFKITASKTFDNYAITRLKLKFLLAESRESQLEKKHLIRIVR
jgi:4-amino-4-deoxy-L-arabinose transferase-like glycosyltransferase